MKSKFKLILVFLIIFLIGIESWFLLISPSHITLQTMQLSRVHWAKDENINHLRGRKVIAIFYGLREGDDEELGRAEINLSRINALVGSIVTEKPAKIDDRPFFSLQYMLFVCDDNTGVRIGYSPDFDRKSIYGAYWISKELWQIWERVNGPFQLLTSPVRTYPGITTTQAEQIEKQMESMNRSKK